MKSFISFFRVSLKKAVLLLTLSLVLISLGGRQADARTLRVALLRHPQSLNFFGASDVWSRKILQFFHMPLYILLR